MEAAEWLWPHLPGGREGGAEQEKFKGKEDSKSNQRLKK